MVRNAWRDTALAFGASREVLCGAFRAGVVRATAYLGAGCVREDDANAYGMSQTGRAILPCCVNVASERSLQLKVGFTQRAEG